MAHDVVEVAKAVVRQREAQAANARRATVTHEDGHILVEWPRGVVAARRTAEAVAFLRRIEPSELHYISGFRVAGTAADADRAIEALRAAGFLVNEKRAFVQCACGMQHLAEWDGCRLLADGDATLALAEALMAATAEAAVTKEALLTHGSHRRDCGRATGGKECDCGYYAALRGCNLTNEQRARMAEEMRDVPIRVSFADRPDHTVTVDATFSATTMRGMPQHALALLQSIEGALRGDFPGKAREAGVRAGMEWAAQDAEARARRNETCPPGCKCANGYHIASAIRSAASDSERVEAIARGAKS